ncbi:hypothetical protein [Azospirillum melinis]|nr:hypothetical protein [Azospirillum melinis]
MSCIASRPTMKSIPAASLTAGQIVWLEGFRFTCVGVRPDPIGNGSEKAPQPRIVAALEWSGEGRDPGPGYRTMTAGRALDWCWTVE